LPQTRGKSCHRHGTIAVQPVDVFASAKVGLFSLQLLLPVVRHCLSNLDLSILDYGQEPWDVSRFLVKNAEMKGYFQMYRFRAIGTVASKTPARMG